MLLLRKTSIVIRNDMGSFTRKLTACFVWTVYCWYVLRVSLRTRCLSESHPTVRTIKHNVVALHLSLPQEPNLKNIKKNKTIGYVGSDTLSPACNKYEVAKEIARC